MNDPATITNIKGRPKRRNGCLGSLDRYIAPTRSPKLDEAVGVRRKGLAWKAGIFVAENPTFIHINYP